MPPSARCTTRRASQESGACNHSMRSTPIRYPRGRPGGRVVAMDTGPTTGGRGARSLRERLRAALPEAMKARDAVAVAALRSALAAIDNAEAVAAAPAPPGAGSADVAGAAVGVRAAE